MVVAMSGVARRWARKHARFILVGIVPALLLACGVVQYILNHFFMRPPYLLDSGLLSGVTYRSGVALQTSSIACNYATSFYQVYFSPIIGVLSGLSYLVPLGRIEWFALVEGLVYLPIGLAVYGVARACQREAKALDVLSAALAAFMFASSGLVLRMIAYPHYEAAMSGLVCLLLGAVVTGRLRTAWLMLVLAASVRQDGGLHVALAMTPVLYLERRGVALGVSRRQLSLLFGCAIAASALCFIVQQLLVVPVDRIGPIYVGTPVYAHVTWALVVERARVFAETCQVIYYPFVATVVLALLRRDLRYLLGWVASVPWLVFNLIAVDDSKARFSGYTVGPFLVAMFWAYVYGAHIVGPGRRMRWFGSTDLAFAVICAVSTLGELRHDPGSASRTVGDMLELGHRHRDEVSEIVARFAAHRVELGRIHADYAFAAVAMDWLVYENTLQRSVPPSDTIAFHRDSVGIDENAVVPTLVENQIDVCARLGRTGFVVCTRERLLGDVFGGLRMQQLPAVFEFARLYGRARIDDRGLTILAGKTLDGSFGTIGNGHYILTLSLAPNRGASGRIEILDGDTVISSAAIADGATSANVEFRATGLRTSSYRVVSTGQPITISAARMRR